MSLGLLNKRIGRIQQRDRKRARFVPQESWNMFRVSPTCPPSKKLNVRGGRLYATYNPTLADIDDYQYRAWTVPSLIADIGDIDSVGVDVEFVNANYYQLFILELRIPKVIEGPSVSDWWFYIHTIYNEFPTPGGAESWLHSRDFQETADTWSGTCWDHGDEDFVSYPLCGLILKNDGNVGGGCRILPIDRVNRGRSYMWPADFRPITSIYD